MDYKKKDEIQARVLKYSAKKSGQEKYKYAYALGLAWGMLNDDQVKFLEKMIEKEGE